MVPAFRVAQRRKYEAWGGGAKKCPLRGLHGSPWREQGSAQQKLKVMDMVASGDRQGGEEWIEHFKAVRDGNCMKCSLSSWRVGLHKTQNNPESREQ